MKNAITANELKTQGVTLLDKVTAEFGEALISVRGKTRYVILTLDEYNRLRKYEMEAAILESKKDIAEGRFVEESVEDHLKRIAGV